MIEIVNSRMLVFDPKDSGDDFYYKGKLQTRRDVNKREKRDHQFAYDVVFGPESDNEDVFQRSTKDLVDVLFFGYNCSGKNRKALWFQFVHLWKGSCIHFSDSVCVWRHWCWQDLHHAWVQVESRPDIPDCG